MFAESSEAQRQEFGREGSQADTRRRQDPRAQSKSAPPPLSKTSVILRGSLERWWDHARTKFLWSLAKESLAAFHLI